MMRGHRDLTVFQFPYRLTMELFEVSKGFSKEQRYSLTDQIRRSSRSVAANIGEGFRKRQYQKKSIRKPTRTQRPPITALRQGVDHATSSATAPGYGNSGPAPARTLRSTQILGAVLAFPRALATDLSRYARSVHLDRGLGSRSAEL
jgi:hypothetical protein